MKKKTVDAEPGKVDELLNEDTGGRNPTGFFKHLIFYLAVAWSVFQLWYASPLPFIFNIGIFNDTQARSIHLTFSIILAFLAFPAFKKSPRNYVPYLDIIFAVIGGLCASYIFLNYEALSNRPGNPTTLDLTAGIVGILFLLEAARRTLGPALVIIASTFIFYTYAGPYMPELIAHQGVSLNQLITHQWITTEGVFGIALGVSTSFVFLFVLFGAILEQAGAGNYFIQSAFSLFGHYRGGPGKAAVVSSGLTGLISGSSIANVVTTGTFTIPMMRKVGFSKEKAGAIEVAASVNGQIMPPVMGAAAFLMVEYVGIPYIQVIKHAFLPALISYIGLVYIVHLEAVKNNMQGLKKTEGSSKKTLLQKLTSFVGGFLFIIIIAALSYFLISKLKILFGESSIYPIAALLFVSYIGLLKLTCNYPKISSQLSSTTTPLVKQTLMSGLHYILPVVVLIWCLMIERLSPGLSAFWASMFLIFILVTQKPLAALFRKNQNNSLMNEFKYGLSDLINSFHVGAKNMIGIGIATATAGIIVGAVSQTGVGSVLAELVEVVSRGNILVILALTAVLSLILGMGLPTTANYIVVSSLLAPVIVQLGQSSGVIVPLIAVHLFVFYFGIMADVTPPVGLASFAAAAVSKGDPIKTGIQAFKYSLRTAILPFLFFFNTSLLLIDVGPFEGIFVFIISTAALLIFTSALQGYFLIKNKWYESLIFVAIAFTLFQPNYWINTFYPKYVNYSSDKIEESLANLKKNENVRFKVRGENSFGEIKNFVFLAKTPEKSNNFNQSLENLGFEIFKDDQKTLVDFVEFNGPAKNAGLQMDQEILTIQRYAKQPWKYWPIFPAIAMFLVVFFRQRKKLLGKLVN